MQHESKSAASSKTIPGQNTGTGSQDAHRHQKDAEHHKFHKVAKQIDKDDQLSQARAQQDSVDVQPSEELQPEIPKVGSRDAPGG
jgi:hypothetical protein